MINKKTTALYRHYNTHGQLLYIGISLSAINRTKLHSYKAPWYEQISHIKIEKLPTRKAALEAEKMAVKNERPLHNKLKGRPRKRSSIKYCFASFVVPMPLKKQLSKLAKEQKRSLSQQVILLLSGALNGK